MCITLSPQPVLSRRTAAKALSEYLHPSATKLVITPDKKGTKARAVQGEPGQDGPTTAMAKSGLSQVIVAR